MNIAKPHPNITIRTTVNVNLSAEQWALRTDQFPRVVIEKVADYLNKRLTQDFNKGCELDIIRVGFGALTERFVLYISPDTEKVFEEVTETLFH